MSIDHDGSQIAALMRPYHIRLLDMAAQDASTTLGIDASFDLEMEEVQQVLDTLAKQIRNVADTTRADVQRLTGQAAEHGWSPADLAREIRALGEIASQTRAELISITESAAAYSRGSLLSYAQSGQVSGTEWLTTDPCPICAPLDGKVAPLGEAFADGIESPPAHPRCRCAIAPILKDDAQPAQPDEQPFDNIDDAHAWAEQSFSDWRDGLTDNEQTELRDYQQTFFRDINGMLRNGDPLIGDWDAMATHLDSAIAKGVLDRDIVVYRGFNGDALAANLDDMEGRVLTDAGYTSTSMDEAVGEKFRRWAAEEGKTPTIAEIHVPKGSTAAYMPVLRDASEDAYNYYKNEYEMLLPRGTSLRVVSTSTQTDADGELIRRMVMEVVHG